MAYTLICTARRRLSMGHCHAIPGKPKQRISSAEASAVACAGAGRPHMDEAFAAAVAALPADPAASAGSLPKSTIPFGTVIVILRTLLQRRSAPATLRPSVVLVHPRGQAGRHVPFRNGLAVPVGPGISVVDQKCGGVGMPDGRR